MTSKILNKGVINERSELNKKRYKKLKVRLTEQLNQLELLQNEEFKQLTHEINFQMKAKGFPRIYETNFETLQEETEELIDEETNKSKELHDLKMQEKLMLTALDKKIQSFETDVNKLQELKLEEMLNSFKKEEISVEMKILEEGIKLMDHFDEFDLKDIYYIKELKRNSVELLKRRIAYRKTILSFINEKMNVLEEIQIEGKLYDDECYRYKVFKGFYENEIQKVDLSVEFRNKLYLKEPTLESLNKINAELAKECKENLELELNNYDVIKKIINDLHMKLENQYTEHHAYERWKIERIFEETRKVNKEHFPIRDRNERNEEMIELLSKHEDVLNKLKSCEIDKLEIKNKIKKLTLKQITKEKELIEEREKLREKKNMLKKELKEVSRSLIAH